MALRAFALGGRSIRLPKSSAFDTRSEICPTNFRARAPAGRAMSGGDNPYPWNVEVPAGLDEAAQMLANAKRTCAEVKLEDLSKAVTDMQGAYHMQNAINKIACVFTKGMMTRVLKVNGWSVGAARQEDFEKMGLTEPFRTPLLTGYTKKPNATLRWEEQGACLVGISAGVGFKLFKPLFPRPEPYTQEELWQACSHLMPIIHISASRIPEAIPPSPASAVACVADWGMLGSVVVGREVPLLGLKPEDVEGATVTLGRVGEESVEGSAGAVLGGPMGSLCWLVNSLNQAGIPLETGHILSTGGGVSLPTDAVEWGDKCSIEAKITGLQEESVGPINMKFSIKDFH